MRRNVVDGAIFGVSIGAIVFFAKSLFDSALWVQAAFVVLGGMLLFAVHLLLQRIRAGLARRARTTDTQRAPDAPPVRSPRLDWNGRSPAPLEAAPLPANADAALPHTLAAATRSARLEGDGDEPQPAQEDQVPPSNGKEA